MRVMRTSWPLILLGLIKSTAQSANTTCDLSTEFDCGTGSLGCLPNAWQCDNVKDCHNGADEIDCEPGEYPEGDYIGPKCMLSNNKCDGFPDCYHGRDEQYCQYNSRRLNVPAPFNFGDPSLYTYDGGLDTYHGGREKKNKMMKNGCLPGFGYCSSLEICIPNRSFCDGKVDCLNSRDDERNCTRDYPTGIPRYYTKIRNPVDPCNHKFVCKTNETYKDKVCIQMEEVCNGKKECPLGDDESEKCSECSTKHCEYQCKNTLDGAKCECRKGYRLNPDGFSCVDIDECTLPERACHHFCENHIGSFRCSCAKGYHLKTDGKSCELTNPSKGSLLFSFGNKIEERPLEDFSRANFTNVHKLDGIIRTFDYFHRDHKLFMMTCDELPLCKGTNLVMKEDGKSSRILRENVTFPFHLAVDWIGGNIFFTDIVREDNNEAALTTRISVCTMDGKFCRGILEAKQYDLFSAFAIHPIRGLVFYTDHTEYAVRIMMATMDGLQKQVLVEIKFTISMSMAIDYLNHDLYFADMTNANIQRINIDTKKTTIIASKDQISFTASMVYHNGFLYTTEHNTHLQVLDVTRANARVHMASYINKLAVYRSHIAVNDSRHQLEPSHNPCQELDCPWICVLVSDWN